MKIFNTQYKAFFFDFDGVLVDSVEVKTNAFAKLFEKFGSEIQAKVVEHHRNNGGMTRKDKFVYYYQNYLKKPLDHVEMEQLCNTFSGLVVDNVVAAPEIPGAENFLKKWHNTVKCFVVSATPDEEILEIVTRRGLKIYFLEILGSSMSKQENIRFLLEKHGLNPEKCLFFGDAESDYRAAMACNVNFIGIVTGPDAPLLRVASGIKWAPNFMKLEIQ